MAWTTIKADPDALDEAIADFEGTVTSIDGSSITMYGRNQVVALIQYTA